MIEHLSIQGLAIIESLSIDFTPGFNVITGETGAGKSILIKALNAVMGGKLTADAIRKGESQAVVSAEFLVPNDHPSILIMGNLGIAPQEEGKNARILIRRQVTAKGRSQSWVNDVPLTGPPLRELGSTLLDVFSQHENQKLLLSIHHLKHVDAFLKDTTIKSKLERKLDEAEALAKSLREKIATFAARQKDKDYLQFRAEALKKFAPTHEDYLEVKNLCEQSSGQRGQRDKIVKVLDCLTGGEPDQSVARYLFEASKLVSRFEGDDTFSKINERLLSLANEIEEIHYQLEKLASGVEVNEEELEAAQQRLFGYQDLFRKHNARDIETLMEENARVMEELSFLDTAESHLSETLKKLLDLTKLIGTDAETLGKARRTAAGVIKKRVQAELQELAMKGSIFEIEFAPYQRTIADLDLSAFSPDLQKDWKLVSERLSHVGDNGGERAQFLLASNPGEPMMPLDKIASGGELSRIMLAFKKALAADAETCVLVFDEIDSGISGRVADVVGKKMQELSDDFQVLCISHLPQVAVYADSHFLVKKEGKGERTETQILRLSNDQSAKEIARLLSGATLSTPSLQNAKALIAKAKGKRPKPAELRP